MEVKNLIKDKVINEVNSYCGSYLPDWRPGQDYKKTYSSIVELGGGVHLDLIHELDYMYWLFGEPLSKSKTLRSKSHLNIEAVDYANYLLVYKDFCANVTLNYFRRKPKRTLEILCENGTYLVNVIENTISFDGVIIFKSNKNIVDTYLDQMSFFKNEILNKNIKFNEVWEAYNVLKLCIED